MYVTRWGTSLKTPSEYKSCGYLQGFQYGKNTLIWAFSVTVALWMWSSRKVRLLSAPQLLILNIINMVKLKRLTVEKIDPSVNQKGQIEFSFNEMYLCKNQVGGIFMMSNNPSIRDNWVDKEVMNYCISNNLQLCTIYTTGQIPNYTNIVVDETVKELLENL